MQSSSTAVSGHLIHMLDAITGLLSLSNTLKVKGSDAQTCFNALGDVIVVSQHHSLCFAPKQTKTLVAFPPTLVAPHLF